MGDIEVAILQAALVQRTEDATTRLRAALMAAYEVYAGSDGFIPQTAAEGYQQQIIKQMVTEIQKGLGICPVAQRQMSVDPKSFELAQHFLAGEKNVSEDEPWALARDIQDAVENYVSAREGRT